MIAVTTVDGKLRVVAELQIPTATSGQWTEARIAKLIETIKQTVDAAEMVDAVAKEMDREAIAKERLLMMGKVA